jgi:hypothetical protein
MAEDFRMPMPLDGGDCLCPDCLRKAAAGADACDKREAFAQGSEATTCPP